MRTQISTTVGSLGWDMQVKLIITVGTLHMLDWSDQRHQFWLDSTIVMEAREEAALAKTLVSFSRPIHSHIKTLSAEYDCP